LNVLVKHPSSNSINPFPSPSPTLPHIPAHSIAKAAAAPKTNAPPAFNPAAAPVEVLAAAPVPVGVLVASVVNKTLVNVFTPALEVLVVLFEYPLQLLVLLVVVFAKLDVLVTTELLELEVTVGVGVGVGVGVVIVATMAFTSFASADVILAKKDEAAGGNSAI
jgi:hypothetical protein